ncbi:hypothetical protein BD626DRAFT_398869 [Schizophyllum amplum]|uniref:Protein HGH1 homolog n=1 Tax=Schizophyllum amplum TaxID=97359 RepID=A0A550CKW0_9AGAR|nr:hypothetical protein BD626DRAFT_398869 [Auriculariopsis ampla]
MSSSELSELVGFLRDRNGSVRQIALSHLLAHTTPGAAHRSMFAGGPLRDLKVLCRDQLAVAHDAFRALVNLSDDATYAAAIADKPFLTFLAAYTAAPHATLADLAAMLLSNLTAGAQAASTLAALELPVLPDPAAPKGAPPSAALFPVDARCGSCPAPVPYPPGEPRRIRALALLLDAFVQGAPLTDTALHRPRKSALHFMASVCANMSATAIGRQFFLTPAPRDPSSPSPLEFPLAKIVSFTDHPDRIRRAGVASTIKNCAFFVPAHRAMLAGETALVMAHKFAKSANEPARLRAPGIDVLVPLLLPLAGPEEMDLEDTEKLPPALQFLPPEKEREKDAPTRHTLLEALLLLATTRAGREKLRSNGVYEVVRGAHLVEGVEGIHETIERLVNMLKRPEAEGAWVDEEEGEDELAALVDEVGTLAGDVDGMKLGTSICISLAVPSSACVSFASFPPSFASFSPSFALL